MSHVTYTSHVTVKHEATGAPTYSCHIRSKEPLISDQRVPYIQSKEPLISYQKSFLDSIQRAPLFDPKSLMFKQESICVFDQNSPISDHKSPIL